MVLHAETTVLVTVGIKHGAMRSNKNESTKKVDEKRDSYIFSFRPGSNVTHTHTHTRVDRSDLI